MKTDVKLRGAQSLRQALRKRGELPGLETALALLGTDLRSQAGANLEQSGLPAALVRRLQNSLRETVQADGNYTLSSDDPLAAQIEHGTVRREAAPWLLPALMAMQKSVRERIRALIKN